VGDNNIGKTKVDEKTLQEVIEKKAYELYEQGEKGHGKNLNDRLKAERIVRGRKKI
jgi:DUF2934 family protein